MSTVTLLKSHPYVKNFSVSFFEMGNGLVRVKWRQFDTQKTDQDCAGWEEARALGVHLKETCHILDEYDLQDFDTHSKFWREVFK